MTQDEAEAVACRIIGICARATSDTELVKQLAAFAIAAEDAARLAERERAAAIAEDEGVRLYNSKDEVNPLTAVQSCRKAAARIRAGA